MAHDSRHERPSRRGRMDDTGGDAEGGRKLYYHLTLLAESNVGYRNLIQLSSRAYLEGYYYKPRLDWELLEQHSEGVIATTGCLGGHVLQSLLRGDEEGALKQAGRLQDIFGRDNLFVELQDHGIPEQHRTNPQLFEIARRIGAPLARHQRQPLHDREDAVAHDALLCVQTGALMSDPDRFKFSGDDHYLKTAGEMRRLFGEVEVACDNTLWIAERATSRSSSASRCCPSSRCPRASPTTPSTSDTSRSRGRGSAGARSSPTPSSSGSPTSCRSSGTWGSARTSSSPGTSSATPATLSIRVGPGRGSAAGCAVAYCLRITDLDPIRYDLLFERFLNPSRISMPDIDMDFDSRYRDEMIRYAAERYGRDHVAQIVTFSTIKARAAVRDAARVLGYPYAVGDKVAKAMPPLIMGRDTPLHACLEQQEKYVDGYKMAGDLRTMYETDDDARKVIDVAKGLEGLRRQDGIHAAAVVITKDPLTEYLPIQRKPESGQAPEDAPVVTQYEMGGVEELGLLKMDFLGLRNLDVITDTVEVIEQFRGVDVDIDAIPLDDQATFELLSAGTPSACSSWSRRRCGRCCGPSPPRPSRTPPRSSRCTGPGRWRRTCTTTTPTARTAEAGRVLPQRRRGGARRHLRPDDLPGVGDAGEPALRRLLPGRGRQPAQGVRQEEARPDGQGAGEVRGRLRGHRLRPGAGHPAVRHHRELRRLRLRQEPQLRLRPDHLPDRLPEGPLPGRVPRGPADEREVDAGEGGGLPQRVPPAASRCWCPTSTAPRRTSCRAASRTARR